MNVRKEGAIPIEQVPLLKVFDLDGYPMLVAQVNNEITYINLSLGISEEIHNKQQLVVPYEVDVVLTGIWS